MSVSEIRCTSHLPKLVEAGARNCYNSFDFAKPDSHQLVKRLMFMPDPHLSIGHHGNILICLDTPDLPVAQLKKYDLRLHRLLQALSFGSKRYLTITTKEEFPTSDYEAVISGNIVAWTNALKYVSTELDLSDKLLYMMLLDIEGKFKQTPETSFFLSKDEGYAHVDNPYVKIQKEFTASGERSRILAIDDYSDILTPDECEIHETASVVMRTSRDMSMQFNRHDAGISQLSQRYVLPFDLEGVKFKDFVANLTQEDYDKIPFNFHVPVGLDPDEPIKLHLDELEDGGFGDPMTKVDFDSKQLLWNSEMTYNQMMEVVKTFFFSTFFHMYPEREKMWKRANEVARSLLPNNMDTIIYYTRNKWKWRHFLSLRTEAHTQVEARREAIPLLALFQSEQWFTEYEIHNEKLVARVKKGETKDEE